MAIILIIAGVASFIYGVLTLLGRTKQWAEDSKLDKILFSERSRYLLSRYYGGLGFVVTGLGAIALGLIFYFSH